MILAKIPQRELDALRAKARSHDAYLEACKVMGGRQTGMLAVTVAGAWTDYQRGWLACLREFSQAVVDAGKEYESE